MGGDRPSTSVHHHPRQPRSAAEQSTPGNDRRPPVPALPDLGTETAAASEHLGTRFVKTPFHRVHNLAEYWALYAVETDHIQSLRHQHNLSDDAFHDLQAHWLGRIERELADTSEQHRRKSHEAMLNSHVARRLRGRNFLFQVWSNTIGPGARCWIGNRYMPIRRHTFRLRWRPWRVPLSAGAFRAEPDDPCADHAIPRHRHAQGTTTSLVVGDLGNIAEVAHFGRGEHGLSQ